VGTLQSATSTSTSIATLLYIAIYLGLQDFDAVLRRPLIHPYNSCEAPSLRSFDF
jgi:5-methylcytosine-specific restriction endonuclease McrBC regulatory subunit McrC